MVKLQGYVKTKRTNNKLVELKLLENTEFYTTDAKLRTVNVSATIEQHFRTPRERTK